MIVYISCLVGQVLPLSETPVIVVLTFIIMQHLFTLCESLCDLNMAEIQNTLPEGTFSHSQKHSHTELEAVVYRMADEFKSIVIERACSKRTKVIHDVAQLSLTMR